MENRNVTIAKVLPKLVPVRIKTQGLPWYKQMWVLAIQTREWRVEEDWTCTLRDGTEILIPAGFVFNGASVPKPLRMFLSPTGVLLIPALLHDYGYRYDQLLQIDKTGNVLPYKKGAGKMFWDGLFLEVGNDINGIGFVNGASWAFLQLGGHFSWRKHRSNNKKVGE
jgi:hypothetical protein